MSELCAGLLPLRLFLSYPGSTQVSGGGGGGGGQSPDVQPSRVSAEMAQEGGGWVERRPLGSGVEPIADPGAGQDLRGPVSGFAVGCCLKHPQQSLPLPPSVRESQVQGRSGHSPKTLGGPLGPNGGRQVFGELDSSYRSSY